MLTRLRAAAIAGLACLLLLPPMEACPGPLARVWQYIRVFSERPNRGRDIACRTVMLKEGHDSAKCSGSRSLAE